jgi:uncharacterized protein YbaP (TraB family)
VTFRRIRALFWVLAFGTLAPAARAEDAMFAEQPGVRGFLYQVHDKKDARHHLYLCGTIHVGNAKRTPFTAPVRRALADSRLLALEADPSDLGSLAGGVMDKMLYPAGDSLDRYLPAATLAELRMTLPRVHLDEQRVLRMRLWMVPMAIGLAEGEALGLSGGYGTEVYLAAYAKTHGLPIVELEGAAAQMAILSAEPEDLQREALIDTLREVQSGESKKKLQEIVRTWNEADAKGADKIVVEAHQSKHRSEREFARRLLDDRNVKMAARAEELLRADKTTFMAVGTAHLFGTAGLISLLKKRGYAVDPLR